MNLTIKICAFFILPFFLASKLQASSFNGFLSPDETLREALRVEQSYSKYDYTEKRNQIKKAIKAIKNGANHTITHAKYTTFMRAVMLHLPDLAIELHNLGFVDPLQKPPCSQNILNLALEYNNPEVAIELLKNPKTQIGQALFFAISSRNASLTLTLIQDPRTNLNQQSRRCGGKQTILIEGGKTALRMAMDHKNDEQVIIALIEHPSAHINAKSLNKENILQRFINTLQFRYPPTTSSVEKIISMLLKRGAYPFIQMHEADARRFPKVQKILAQGDVAYNKANAAVFLHLAEKYRLKKLQKLKNPNRTGSLDIPAILTNVFEYLNVPKQAL